MSLSFKTIMFCIVLVIFLPTAYFMDYKDGHMKVEAVKARYEQADKDTAESVKKPVDQLNQNCQECIDAAVHDLGKG